MPSTGDEVCIPRNKWPDLPLLPEIGTSRKSDGLQERPKLCDNFARCCKMEDSSSASARIRLPLSGSGDMPPCRDLRDLGTTAFLHR